MKESVLISTHLRLHATIQILVVSIIPVLLETPAALMQPAVGESWWLMHMFAGDLTCLPIARKQSTRWTFVALVLGLPSGARLIFGLVGSFLLSMPTRRGTRDMEPFASCA